MRRAKRTRSYAPFTLTPRFRFSAKLNRVRHGGADETPPALATRTKRAVERRGRRVRSRSLRHRLHSTHISRPRGVRANLPCSFRPDGALARRVNLPVVYSSIIGPASLRFASRHVSRVVISLRDPLHRAPSVASRETTRLFSCRELLVSPAPRNQRITDKSVPGTEGDGAEKLMAFVECLH